MHRIILRNNYRNNSFKPDNEVVINRLKTSVSPAFNHFIIDFSLLIDKVFNLNRLCLYCFRIDPDVEPTKNLTYIRKSMNLLSQDQKHLVPLTDELSRLNYSWQRKIIEERERQRNIYMNEEDNNIVVERTNLDPDQPLLLPVENLVLCDEDKISTSFDGIMPVSIIIDTNIHSQEYVVSKFTLNKNQKAAFMIITSHLNGADKSNAGKAIKRNYFFNRNFCR